jgi:putative transposase
MPRKSKGNGWGGARPGAGRRPNGEVAGVSHLRRPALARHLPLQIIMKVQPDLPSLLTPSLLTEVRGALDAGSERFGFRLIDFSVARDRLELVVQAKDRRALSRGMQGISIRVARAINRQLERTGKVFADRYEAGEVKKKRAKRSTPGSKAARASR